MIKELYWVQDAGRHPAEENVSFLIEVYLLSERPTQVWVLDELHRVHEYWVRSLADVEEEQQPFPGRTVQTSLLLVDCNIRGP